MYKTTNRIVKFDGTKCSGVVRLSDLMVIPDDENLPEYAEYLAWVAEGNIAESWDQETEQ